MGIARMRIVIASQTAKRQSMAKLEELGYGCPQPRSASCFIINDDVLPTLAFIGTGNLATAIVKGLLAQQAYRPSDLTCTSQQG